MINCILLVLLLVLSMILLKCTNSSLVIPFLNFELLFHLQVLLIITLPVSRFLSRLVSNDGSCKDTFSFVSQIKNANTSRKFLVSYDVTSLLTNIRLQQTIDLAINVILNHYPNLNIIRKERKKVFLFATSQTILFLTPSFKIKSIQQPWGLLQLLSLLICSWVFSNLSG